MDWFDLNLIRVNFFWMNLFLWILCWNILYPGRGVLALTVLCFVDLRSDYCWYRVQAYSMWFEKLLNKKGRNHIETTENQTQGIRSQPQSNHQPTPSIFVHAAKWINKRIHVPPTIDSPRLSYFRMSLPPLLREWVSHQIHRASSSHDTQLSSDERFPKVLDQATLLSAFGNWPGGPWSYAVQCSSICIFFNDQSCGPNARSTE